ncbi:hypothetical protein ACFL7M_16145 [Thermodesulfobacteriota bacterium]
MKRLEREGSNESDEYDSIQTEQGRRELELEQKKKDLRKVSIEKIIKSQFELLYDLNKSLINSSKTPMSIIKATYNTDSDPPGKNLDLSV